MNEISQLEMLTESIRNGIEELESLLQNSDKVLLKAKKQSFQKKLNNIISNLESTNDSIYSVYENLNVNDIEKLEADYDILYEILEEKLSYDEKLALKLKHKIEFY